MSNGKCSLPSSLSAWVQGGPRRQQRRNRLHLLRAFRAAGLGIGFFFFCTLTCANWVSTGEVFPQRCVQLRGGELELRQSKLGTWKNVEFRCWMVDYKTTATGLGKTAHKPKDVNGSSMCLEVGSKTVPRGRANNRARCDITKGPFTRTSGCKTHTHKKASTILY